MATTDDRPRVGFAGLGNIGFPMAESLVRAGLAPTVYDIDAERMRAGERAGMTAAGELRELARCEVVALAVPDDTAATRVLLGDDEGHGNGRTGSAGSGDGVPGGLLAAMAPGSLVLLHSTLLPGTVRHLARCAAARDLELVDAPVSGGAERARRGDLTVLAGGTERAMALARPCLTAVASAVVHVGDAGAGAVAKLANQLMMFAALAGAYEAFELAEAYGVEPAAVRRAVATSTGDSWVAREWGFFDRVAADYDRTGVPPHLRPWSKDLWDVVASARDVRLPLPFAGLLAQSLAERVERHAAEHRPPQSDAP